MINGNQIKIEISTGSKRDVTSFLRCWAFLARSSLFLNVGKAENEAPESSIYEEIDLFLGGNQRCLGHHIIGLLRVILIDTTLSGYIIFIFPKDELRLLHPVLYFTLEFLIEAWAIFGKSLVT